MADSNPMRWVVWGFIAAGLFAVGMVMLVQNRVDAAKAKAAATAEGRAALDRASAVAAAFVADVGAGRFAAAYARLAAPYRAAVSPQAFAGACRASPILAGARDVAFRHLEEQAYERASTLEADGVLGSSAGAVPVRFVFLSEAAGPRILTVSLAGVPVLQGVAPVR
jgi:hypothetical protein